MNERTTTTDAVDESEPIDSSRRAEATGLSQVLSADARTFVGRYGIPVTLVLFIAIFSLLAPDTFFTRGNFEAIVGTQAALLFVALAVTIPLAAGDFDLSIGFVLGFTMAVVGVLTINHDWAWWTAALVAVTIGLGVGVVNGFFIVRLGVNAFVVTLGTGTVLSGLTLAITNGETISGIPEPLISLSRADILGLPLISFYAVAFAVVLWYVFEHTPLGRYLFFVGGGREAARLAGVSVGAIRFGAFVASAGICGLAGVLYAGQLDAASPGIGPNFLLPAYAAAFLGATTIKPGRFNAWGTFVSLYLLATGITGLQLLGAPFWLEPVFNGAALTLAVTVARIAAREPTD